MALADLIFGRLTVDSATTAIAGTRVYPVKAPQDGDMPCIVFQTVSRLPQPGSVGFFLIREQVDCYAKTYATAWALAKAASEAVRMWQDRSGLPAIVNAMDGELSDGWAEESGVYRVTFDFQVWTYEGGT